jgi:hypothetical protein
VAVLKPPRDETGQVSLARESERYVPPAESGDARFAPDALGDVQGIGWRVHVESLRRLKARCDAAGARLVAFDLGHPLPFSRAVESAARDLGIDYDPIGREVADRARAGEEMYLRGDGHWSPDGAEVIARGLARSLPSRK